MLLMCAFNAALDKGFLCQTAEAGEECDFMLNTGNIGYPSAPVWPFAEVVGSGTQCTQAASLRIQRIINIEHLTILRSSVLKLAERMATLSQHKEHLFETTTSHFCSPANEHYVFALRRIII